MAAQESGVTTEGLADERSLQNLDVSSTKHGETRRGDGQVEQQTTAATTSASTPTAAASITAAASAASTPDTTSASEIATQDEGEGFFVVKSQLESAVRTLLQHGRLILAGPPGSGKTYLAHGLMQMFRQNGYVPMFGADICVHCRDMLDSETGLKRIFLFDKFGYDIEDSRKTLSEVSSFCFNTQRLRNKKGWNCLVMATVFPHVIKRIHKSFDDEMRRLTHPKIVLWMNRDPLQPCLPFVPTIDTVVPFMASILRSHRYGNLFSCVLALEMANKKFYSYEAMLEEVKRLGYDINLEGTGYMFLMEYLRGIIFIPDDDVFINRDVYDASGFVLGRNGAMDLLLKVCDAKFLVDYVRLDDDAKVSPRCLVVPRIRVHQRALVLHRMYELIVDVGAARKLVQHPSLSCEHVVQEFAEYCSGREGYVPRLTKAVDAESSLPLLYWSLWVPSPHLTHWCLNAMKQCVGKESDLSEADLSSILACVVLTQQGTSVHLALKDLIKRLAHLQFKPDKNSLHLTWPDPNSERKDMRTRLDELKTRARAGLRYLEDSAFRLPPSLLSLTVNEDAVHLTVSRDHGYLILRLLTDTEPEEKDEMGNTLLHVAVDVGDTKVIKMIVKTGASLTARNRQGLTPPDVAGKKMVMEGEQARRSEESDSKRFLSASSDGDSETVKVLLCQGISLQVKDSEGNTPVDLAKREGHTGLVSLMLQLQEHSAHGQQVR